MTTDSFVVKPDPLPRRLDRRAGGQRDGQRPRGRRRAPARADARRSCSRRASRPTTCAPRSRRSPARPRGGGRRDRRGGHQGRRARQVRRDVRHDDGLGRIDPRASLSPRLAAARRPHPALRADRRARHRGDARPRRVRARAPRRLGHAFALARGGHAAAGRRRPRCAVCATRPAAASHPPSTRWPRRPVAMRRARGRRARAPAVAGACEILGIDPMYVANEGVLVAFVAPEAADDALAALASSPGCERRRRDRRGQDGAAGDGARRDARSVDGA